MNVFKRVTFFSLVLTSAISAERLDQTALAMYGSAVNAVGQLADNVQPVCEFAKEKVTDIVKAVVASDVFADAVFIAQHHKLEVFCAWIGAKVAKSLEGYRYEEITMKDKVTNYMLMVAGGIYGTVCASGLKDIDLVISGYDAHYVSELLHLYGLFFKHVGSAIDGLKSVAITAVDEINKHPKAALAGAVAGALVYKVVTDARAKNNSKNVYNQYPYVVSC